MSSISSYYGNTFVAFLDISGFKKLMKDKEKARSVLRNFYSSLFNQVADFNNGVNPIKVNVVAISDSAIIFLSNNENASIDQEVGLERVLKFISKVNSDFVKKEFPFLTTCSIAYGDFTYNNWRERDRIRKNCIEGLAYLNAYQDSEDEVEKLRPGQCRVVRDGLSIDPMRMNLAIKKTGKHYYFYWRLKDRKYIKHFQSSYDDLYDKLFSDLTRLHQNPQVFLRKYLRRKT